MSPEPAEACPAARHPLRPVVFGQGGAKTIRLDLSSPRIAPMSKTNRLRRFFRQPRHEQVRAKPRRVGAFDRLEERVVLSSFTVTDNTDLVTDTGSLRYAI